MEANGYLHGSRTPVPQEIVGFDVAYTRFIVKKYKATGIVFYSIYSCSTSTYPGLVEGGQDEIK